MVRIEQIERKKRLYALIIRNAATAKKTEFLTKPESNFQMGFVVYPRGGEVPRHFHKPLKRRVDGTSEVLLVKKGRCLLDIYDDRRKLIATRELKKGDVLLLVAGGHGLRMLSNTVLLEVKQGPYHGVEEKERF